MLSNPRLKVAYEQEVARWEARHQQGAAKGRGKGAFASAAASSSSSSSKFGQVWNSSRASSSTRGVSGSAGRARRGQDLQVCLPRPSSGPPIPQFKPAPAHGRNQVLSKFLLLLC